MQLEEFLKSSLRNSWLEYPYMRVYVRRSYRQFAGMRVGRNMEPNCLDIANIEVRESHWRRGICKAFLQRAEDINTLNGIYIESVINENLHKFLLSVGYNSVGFEEINFYKTTKK